MSTTSSSSNEQYLRQCSFVVGDDSTGVELGNLHIKFKITHKDYETPNNATIRVYNVSDSTAKLVKKEFTNIVLQAGYSELGIIFTGNIRQVRRGQESNTDTYVEILASDGDLAYNYAVVNQTISANCTTNQQINAATKALTSYGVTTGSIASVSTTKLPRGKVMYGMARKYMRDAAKTSGASWSIQNGKINFITLSGYLKDTAVELTSATGLIGRPELTNDGLMVRSLINPRFKVGTRIKINNADITANNYSAKIGSWNERVKTNADGLYRVLAIDWTGDTRGNDWYCDLICVGIDASAPAGSKVTDQQ